MDAARLIRTARRRAGLKDLRIHDLRHSFASALVNGGTPLYEVQKLLGHSSIRTTQIYTHVEHSRLKAVHKQCHPRG